MHKKRKKREKTEQVDLKENFACLKTHQTLLLSLDQPRSMKFDSMYRHFYQLCQCNICITPTVKCSKHNQICTPTLCIIMGEFHLDPLTFGIITVRHPRFDLFHLHPYF